MKYEDLYKFIHVFMYNNVTNATMLIALLFHTILLLFWNSAVIGSVYIYT